MEPTNEPAAVKPLRRGILERLKAAGPSEVAGLVVEFGEYTHASPKTARRFARLLKQVKQETPS